MAAAQRLPESEQNTIACLIMAEIADEGQWEKQFAATQQPLERWANKVRADIQASRVHRKGIEEEYTNLNGAVLEFI